MEILCGWLRKMLATYSVAPDVENGLTGTDNSAHQGAAPDTFHLKQTKRRSVVNEASQRIRTGETLQLTDSELKGVERVSVDVLQSILHRQGEISQFNQVEIFVLSFLPAQFNHPSIKSSVHQIIRPSNHPSIKFNLLLPLLPWVWR